MRRPALTALVVVAAACSGDSVGPARSAPRPIVLSDTVVTGTRNVLSAFVTVRARHADSVVVHYALADLPSAADSVAPAVRMSNDTMVVVPVFGLLPGRRYAARVVLHGAGGSTAGDTLRFTTEPLPPDLPRYEAAGTDPSPGFVVFAAGRYGVVLDNTGRVVWYRWFPDGAGLGFTAQPNGRFVLRPPTPQPGDLEPWIEVDPTGEVTRTLGCADGLPSRPHELIAERDGGFWLMCDETREMDLSAVGGATVARVTGTVVQHVGADGALRFRWSVFDHFLITDLDPAQRTGPNVNWTHGNALDFDARGHLLVSFRNLNEVTSIDTATGGVRWRFGGRRNQFRLVNAAAPFMGQHSARALRGGVLQMLDNTGDPAESHAERWTIDERAMTATLSHSYGSPARARTVIGGSVQPLPGGRTLVSFGTAGRVEEYDAAGRLTWQLLGDAGYVFRAQRIASLYAPGLAP